MFLQFYGPTTLLLQTRAARLNDVLSDRDVDEVAGVAPGSSVQTLLPKISRSETREPETDETASNVRPTRMSTATVGASGKVTFEAAKKST